MRNRRSSVEVSDTTMLKNVVLLVNKYSYLISFNSTLGKFGNVLTFHNKIKERMPVIDFIYRNSSIVKAGLVILYL
jgi:hypothetical protein